MTQRAVPKPSGDPITSELRAVLDAQAALGVKMTREEIGPAEAKACVIVRRQKI